MRVAVVIPARNEAIALGRVLAGLPRAAVHDVIVVDNGSTDATAELAVAAGARVVSEPTPGYGRACLAGLAALDLSTDTVVFLDGDYSDYPEELPKLLEPLAQSRADLVIGSRTALAAPGSLTIQQRFGNRLACTLMRVCFGIRYSDLGPFRAIRRDALERLQMRDRTFGWTVEMQAKAAREGLRIVEVPVRYRRRIGRSKISGTVSGTIRAGIAILSTIVKVALTFSARVQPNSSTRVGDISIHPGDVSIFSSVAREKNKNVPGSFRKTETSPRGK
jgi:glycosyltransferase involved in cell wall biosynthesis